MDGVLRHRLIGKNDLEPVFAVHIKRRGLGRSGSRRKEKHCEEEKGRNPRRDQSGHRGAPLGRYSPDKRGLPSTITPGPARRNPSEVRLLRVWKGRGIAAEQ